MANYKKFISRFIPDSLLGRLLLIMIVPTVLTQIIAAYIFYERHWSNVSGKMIDTIAGEVVVIIYATERSSAKEREQIFDLAQQNMDIKVTLQPDVQSKQLRIRRGLPEELKDLYKTISRRTRLPVAVDYLEGSSNIKVMIQLKTGLLTLQIPSRRFSTPTTYIFILWMTGTAFLLTFVAIIFCRNQVRSITNLAAAAEQFGKGIKITRFKPSGAKEVKKAAQEFIKMSERIERQISQRTEMLAGVSHDLRTPLTRMKLQLAMMESSLENKELQSDLETMEHMIKNYLDFVRGDSIEDAEPTNISALLNHIVSQYKNHNLTISLDITENAEIPLKVHSFKRAITNLIDNSAHYAQNILIKLYKQDKEIYIEIHDDGPGIPLDQRELVFKPFYRIDSSRNLDTGSVGLGLAIARDAINSHGGKIILSDSTLLGGLKVIISLPV